MTLACILDVLVTRSTISTLACRRPSASGMAPKLRITHPPTEPRRDTPIPRLRSGTVATAELPDAPSSTPGTGPSAYPSTLQGGGPRARPVRESRRSRRDRFQVYQGCLRSPRCHAQFPRLVFLHVGAEPKNFHKTAKITMLKVIGILQKTFSVA